MHLRTSSSSLVLYADDILLYKPISCQADCAHLQLDIMKLLLSATDKLAAIWMDELTEKWLVGGSMQDTRV